MKKNKMRYRLLVLILVMCSPLWAQDPLTVQAPVDTPAESIRPLREAMFTPDTISVTIDLPPCFENLLPNVITDEAGVLTPVFQALRLARLGAEEDTIRILHIGDSHVRGRFFPNAAADRMAETFGPVSYTNLGVNGASCLTFTHPLRINEIVEQRPHLLILSFGTNESHNRRYNANVHYSQMHELVSILRDSLPDVPMLLTTPPGSYESFRQRNRRRTYSINPRTATAVDAINRFAADHKLAVWDMYTILGGRGRACLNWKEAGLMRPDHVHYEREAYVLQGQLLYQAIVNAYNAYVCF